MNEIAADAVISRIRELMEAPIDRDLVALNVDDGLCYGFNEPAAAIWRKLETPQSFEALVASMSEDFDVTPDDCRSGVERMVHQLTDVGLVAVSPAP